MRHKEGSWRWILDRGMIVERAEDGTPLRMVGTHVDITERKSREEALQESQLLLRQSQRIAHLGHWDWRVTDGSITWSDETYRIFGYAPGGIEVTLETYFDHIPPADRSRIEAVNRESVATGQMPTVQHRIVRADGTERIVELSGIAMDTNADGTPDRAVGTILDVTERERREQALRASKQRAEQAQTEAEEARAVAEEASRLKSALLANMSHEVRTPLTSVIGFAEVLGEMDLEPPADRFTRMIYRGGRRLLDTLNSMLDLSQLEAGAVTMRPKTVAIGPLVRDLVADFELRAQEASVELMVDAPAPSVLATVDVGGLERVVNNLLSNAIKFTGEGQAPGGRVAVDLRAAADQLTLVVTDTGVGIEEGFLPDLFEAFKQESTGDGRGFEGSGLGLAITSELVGLMGGAISVESVKGEGTTFTVTLPRHLEPPKHEAP